VKSNKASNTLSDGGDCDDPDPQSLDIVPRGDAHRRRISDRLGGSLGVSWYRGWDMLAVNNHGQNMYEQDHLDTS
jgi:hypothetical protein